MSSLSKRLSTRMKAESPSKSSKAAKMKKLTEENFERFKASAKTFDKLQVRQTSKDSDVSMDEASDVQNQSCIDDTREVEHSSKGHNVTPKEHEVEFTNSESENCSKQGTTHPEEKSNNVTPKEHEVEFTNSESENCSKQGTTHPEEKSNSSQSSSKSINNSNEKSRDKNSEIEGLNPKQYTANGDQADGKENTTKDDTKSDDAESDSELPTFRNSINKTFYLDLTDEVKDYMKELSAKFADDKQKNPTVAEVKYVGQKALSVLLRFNDRGVPHGTAKEAVARMVHDHMEHGVPPRCPKCKRGSLRFSNGKKKSGKRYYWCPGSTTNGRAFYGCNFKAQKNEIERVPWKNPD